MAAYNLLIVGDDSGLCREAVFALSGRGLGVTVARSERDALERFQKGRFDMVITQLKLPEGDGLQVLKRTKALSPATKVLVVTEPKSLRQAMTAIEMDADDFVLQPINTEELVCRVRRCLDSIALEQDIRRLAAAVRRGALTAAGG